MTKVRRRPLPYAAAGLIDEAIMNITMAKKAIVDTTNPISQEERFRKLVQATNELHEALAALREARSIKPEP